MAKPLLSDAGERRTELAVGLGSIIVGLLGIVVTLLTFPDATKSLSHVVTGTTSVANRDDFANTITLFFASLFIVVGLFFFLIGNAAIVSIICSRFGAARPVPAGIALTCALTFASVSLASFQSSFYFGMMFVLAGIGAIITAVVAVTVEARDDNRNVATITASLLAAAWGFLLLFSLPMHYFQPK